MDYGIATDRDKQTVERRHQIQTELGSTAAKVALEITVIYPPRPALTMPGGKIPGNRREDLRLFRGWLAQQYGVASNRKAAPWYAWSEYETGIRRMPWPLIRRLAREISDMVGNFPHGSRAYEAGSELMRAVRLPGADLCLLDYEDSSDLADLERVLSRMLHRYRDSERITDRLRFERIFQGITKPVVDEMGGNKVNDAGTVDLPPATTGLRTLPYPEMKKFQQKSKSLTPAEDEKEFLTLMKTREILRREADRFDEDIKKRFPDRANLTWDQVDPANEMNRLKAKKSLAATVFVP